MFACVTPILLIGAAALSVLAQTQLAEVFPADPPWSSMRNVQVAAGLIEKSRPPGIYELVINTNEGDAASYADTLGLAWALKAAGWSPFVFWPATLSAGPDYAARPGMRPIVVTVAPGGVTLKPP